MAGTVDIKGVEILSTGTWNGVPFSRRDLDDIVTAFNETRDSLPVTIRLGHDARQAFARALFGSLGTKAADAAAKDANGWPAFGEPSRLYLSGDKLMADLSGVPDALAKWIKDKRYRTRSGGLRYNRTVGGKVYRWMLDHIALLGSDTPAVDGLADIGLSAESAATADVLRAWPGEASLDADADGRLLEFSYSATDADGLVTMGDAQAEAATALDGLLTALSAAMDEHAPLVYGRKGAPMVRQLFAAFLAKLRDSARADLPLSDQGGQMDTTMTLPGVRAMLNLSDTDPAIRVVEALNALDDDGAARLVNLADGMAFESAEQLVGWLAGALAIAPGDLAGIASKVMELMGGDAPELPDGAPAEPGAMPPAEGADMSDKTTLATAGDNELAARVVELSTRNVDLAARVVALETAANKSNAEAKVEADARRLGLALPKPVADTLVELACAGNTTAYEAIIANVRSVPAADKGAGTAGDVVELSAMERDFAKMMGVTPEQVIAQKRANASRGGND